MANNGERKLQYERPSITDRFSEQYILIRDSVQELKNKQEQVPLTPAEEVKLQTQVNTLNEIINEAKRYLASKTSTKPQYRESGKVMKLVLEELSQKCRCGVIIPS